MATDSVITDKMSQVNNQWANIKESMDALLATVKLSSVNVIPEKHVHFSDDISVKLSSTDVIPEKHDYLDISAKDQEITVLKNRIELLEVECAELREDLESDLESDSEIEYDTEEELTNMIDTIRNSIPKHSISKSIFKTIHRLLQDALIDIKETPLYLVYRYIVVEHLPDTRHQEYEIHGHMYVITDTYIYQLCIYQNGHPVRNYQIKYAHFKINAFGIKINGIDKIGFAPIDTKKINLSSLLSAKEYFMKSERYLGKVTNYHELQPLYKKMERFRDLLPMMLYD